MKTLKLLVVANNCQWETWPQKLEELRKWFSPKVDLRIDLIHTSYADIPFVQYVSTAEDQTNLKNALGIEDEWYDTYVSSLAEGYDIVLFVMPDYEWPSANDMRGWRTNRNTGPVELQIGAGEYEDLYRSRKNIGGAFYNYARHEIIHALFMLTGQNDSTHKWWNAGKLEKALEEVLFPTASPVDRQMLIVKILTRLIEMYKELNALKKSKIDVMCEAIQEFEGWFAPGENLKYPNGTISWRLNNPGNLRPANQIGMIGEKGGFAVFKNYQDGYNALRRQIEIAATGKSRVYKPDMSLLQFFQVYAPASDGNYPKKYAEFVAKKMGVGIDYQIKNLIN